MAEKNTLSILETIKRKMHKLDQKVEPKVEASDVGEEFQYMGQGKSETKKSDELPKQTQAAPASAMPEFKDDLGFEDIMNADAPTAPAAVAPKTPAYVPPAPPAAASAPMPAALDDFNLSDFDLDDENSLNQKLPEAVKTVPPVQPQASPEHELEELAMEKHFEDDDEYSEDYEDEVDFAEETDAEEIVEEMEEHKDDDLDFMLNDQEDENEIPTAEKTAEPEVENEEDDLVFDDLDEVEKAEEPVVKDEDEEDEDEDDDFNFDDLESELEPVKTAAPSESKEILTEKVADLSLEELEKESQATAQKLQNQEKLVFEEELLKDTKSADKISSKEDIDLEFEKELMGFKAETKTATAPVNQTPISQPVPEQKIEVVAEKHIVDNHFSAMADVTPAENKAPIINNFPQAEFMKDTTASSLQNFSTSTPQPKIISEDTLRQTSDSVKKLIDAKNMIGGISTFSQSPMLAELAVQLMEPKLEKWCTENLSQLVEKVVREEIKKLIPKE